MNILLLNGSASTTQTEFDLFLQSFEGKLEELGHQISLLTIKDMQINFCIGCFGCWVKHPGKCVFNDEQEKIYRAVLKSDLVILGSPLIMGFINSNIKKVCDRLIPLLRPYVEVFKGEIRHVRRYKKFPKFALLVEKELDTDEEDLILLKEIFERTTRNFHTQLIYLKTTQNSMEEIVYATIGH
ncbi:hypothetical protein NEF87_002013 [Candidatus Lokiarchaeum ossiferum]|uniref:NADPH-dependent FMN reductase-like domain-containing protein n=1 Tax=Candidatus Lokiarchaeum ossiferum TaxID=2951803 RepID=A0ABY6HQD7_9ARCH|nr:hypothetical protein NEF87_002013 [Candidatus Lokiarchaeum sp. B-35]